ncbi:polysaccharide deacetylase family protein [Hanstruepera marina]|uniref:polysaccharide deacetylase family protein n=1 Tax=Hanstruepera marina TaxID=2873265 RepID=UPI001CA77DA5|nr:polysaccharide deacetylase family protein [Hanstruepera marina]
MPSKNGYLLISLDFELFWGVRDVKTKSGYKENLLNVQKVIPRLLELADKYEVKLNFATIGFLFATNKKELLDFAPSIKPTYKNSIFNPYQYIDNIDDGENYNLYHYAPNLIDLINSNKNHEIATHTFSHFYVNETGQTIEQFENDLLAAIAIAKQKGITFKSIVFPRNQINEDYLSVCLKHGITNYRGTEKHWMFDTTDTNRLERPSHKMFRLMDAYFNLSGYNTYPLSNIKSINGVLNIPSSKFFRPYSKSLKALELRRINRVKKGLTYAAKHNEIYHMWWHPHNFGANIEENFNNLETIFKHFTTLKRDYSFNSLTMSEIASIVNAK